MHPALGLIVESMGLHREIRRLHTLGARGYALRTGNDVLRALNRIAPRHHECPCCGWRGWRFLHYLGKGYEIPNAVCPLCKSQGRQRGLYFFLSELMPTLPASGRILHLAPNDRCEEFSPGAPISPTSRPI